MNPRDLNRVGDVLGRRMAEFEGLPDGEAEFEGVPDGEANFPAFRPTFRQDLEVKSWQADLQPGDLLIS